MPTRGGAWSSASCIEAPELQVKLWKMVLLRRPHDYLEIRQGCQWVVAVTPTPMPVHSYRSSSNAKGADRCAETTNHIIVASERTGIQ
jgi:hypothetical protein